MYKICVYTHLHPSPPRIPWPPDAPLPSWPEPWHSAPPPPCSAPRWLIHCSACCLCCVELCPSAVRGILDARSLPQRESRASKLSPEPISPHNSRQPTNALLPVFSKLRMHSACPRKVTNRCAWLSCPSAQWPVCISGLTDSHAAWCFCLGRPLPHALRTLAASRRTTFLLIIP